MLTSSFVYAKPDIVSLVSLVCLCFFSRAKNGGEGECPRVSLWRPRRVENSSSVPPSRRSAASVTYLWCCLCCQRSRRRRPRYFLFLVLEMRNFGNRGFLLRQLAKSQSRKLPPEVTPPDHARNFHIANFTILYQRAQQPRSFGRWVPWQWNGDGHAQGDDAPPWGMRRKARSSPRRRLRRRKTRPCRGARRSSFWGS